MTKDCIFFLGRNYFTSSDGSRNRFVNQKTLDTLELKKTKVLIIFLLGSQREYLILNLRHLLLS